MMPGFSAGLRLPAEHDRLVRPLAAQGPAGERLADRPRGAGDAAATTPASPASTPQDQAVTESMGPITDHLFEHLGALAT